MSKSTLRKDKTCLNCRHVVENKFCPNCGQKNEDTRKTFHHLFIHFFEDLTHYENAFWRTIKNLLFKPAALTKEYLSGKRLSYLAPVRLYIFISFVTFLTISLFSTNINLEKEINKTKNDKEFVKGIEIGLENNKNKDSIKDVIQNIDLNKEKIEINGIKTVKELDSIQKYGTKDQKFGSIGYWLTKKSLKVKENNTVSEVLNKFLESFRQNFPKVLFIYMPIFAIFLWLFHDKKKYFYFDHGIFTLHYFSFLLLIFLVVFLFSRLFDCFVENPITGFLTKVVNLVSIIWAFYYFFPAHHRFYGESRRKSFVKSICLFFINIFLILFILTIFAVYTFINIH
jgi:Protein of unknown function (DUF3667)